MSEKYTMTISREQLRVIGNSLEEYFRLRLGQEFDFVNDIASMNVDLSSENPNHERIFDHMIHTRDALSEVMRCFFRIAFAPYGSTPQKKTQDMLIAEDVWQAIRVARGFCDYPMYFSHELVPEITEVEE